MGPIASQLPLMAALLLAALPVLAEALVDKTAFYRINKRLSSGYPSRSLQQVSQLLAAAPKPKGGGLFAKDLVPALTQIVELGAAAKSANCSRAALKLASDSLDSLARHENGPHDIDLLIRGSREELGLIGELDLACRKEFGARIEAALAQVEPEVVAKTHQFARALLQHWALELGKQFTVKVGLRTMAVEFELQTAEARLSAYLRSRRLIRPSYGSAAYEALLGLARARRDAPLASPIEPSAVAELLHRLVLEPCRAYLSEMGARVDMEGALFLARNYASSRTTAFADHHKDSLAAYHTCQLLIEGRQAKPLLRNILKHLRRKAGPSAGGA